MSAVAAAQAQVRALPLLRILAHALDLVRPFLKLSADQDTAWQIVRGIADQPPLHASD